MIGVYLEAGQTLTTQVTSCNSCSYFIIYTGNTEFEYDTLESNGDGTYTRSYNTTDDKYRIVCVSANGLSNRTTSVTTTESVYDVIRTQTNKIIFMFNGALSVTSACSNWGTVLFGSICSK